MIKKKYLNKHLALLFSLKLLLENLGLFCLIIYISD